MKISPITDQTENEEGDIIRVIMLLHSVGLTITLNTLLTLGFD